MNIGLIDVDSHNFPNLALMKISRITRRRGMMLSGAYRSCKFEDYVPRSDGRKIKEIYKEYFADGR